MKPLPLSFNFFSSVSAEQRERCAALNRERRRRECELRWMARARAQLLHDADVDVYVRWLCFYFVVCTIFVYCCCCFCSRILYCKFCSTFNFVSIAKKYRTSSLLALRTFNYKFQLFNSAFNALRSALRSRSYVFCTRRALSSDCLSWRRPFFQASVFYLLFVEAAKRPHSWFARLDCDVAAYSAVRHTHTLARLAGWLFCYCCCRCCCERLSQLHSVAETKPKHMPHHMVARSRSLALCACVCVCAGVGVGLQIQPYNGHGGHLYNCCVCAVRERATSRRCCCRQRCLFIL